MRFLQYIFILLSFSIAPLSLWAEDHFEVQGLRSNATAISRKILDCSFGDGECYLARYFSEYDYRFGRSEGFGPSGPNPINQYRPDAGGEFKNSYATTDTDQLYDLLGGVHEYYLEKFGRNGANNRGGTGDGYGFSYRETGAYSLVDWANFNLVACPNSYYAFGHFAFCQGIISPEMVGHEYAHAVQHFMIRDNKGKYSGFLYEKESGALAEGYAEVFGEMFEYYQTGDQNWIRQYPNGKICNLRDPEASGKPARLYSDNYSCTSLHNDFGGVHHNSTVLSYAASLIASGGSFNGCDILPLGVEKTERLLYWTLGHCLKPDSGFRDAYQCLGLSCAMQFSESDCLEVEKALRAVEINQEGKCSGKEREDPGCSRVVGGCGDSEGGSNLRICGCVDSPDGLDGAIAPFCVRKYVKQLRPRMPRVTVQNRSIVIRMGVVVGMKYRVMIEVLPRDKGSKVSSFIITSPVQRIRCSSQQTKVQVSYSYAFSGVPGLFSRNSKGRIVVCR